MLVSADVELAIVLSEEFGISIEESREALR